MSNQKKRPRSLNFTMQEKLLLINFLEKNAAVIENKGLEPAIHKKKTECWNRCSDLFTSMGFELEASKLKATYRLKHLAKMNIEKQTLGIHSVNGIPPEEPSNLDYRIISICPSDFILAEEEGKQLKERLSPIQETNCTDIEKKNIIEDITVDVDPETGFLVTANSSNPLKRSMGGSENTLVSKCLRLSETEKAVIEYHQQKIMHQEEIHKMNIQALQTDEKRKEHIHQYQLQIMQEKHELEKRILEMELDKKNLELMNLKMKFSENLKNIIME